MTSEEIIAKLDLIKHPEGGFYKETFRGERLVHFDNDKVRNACTGIYYLLEGTDKSHFHKVGSDELWLFHQGEPLEIITITDDEKIETKTLGNRIEV